jgi:hypothetical protein
MSSRSFVFAVICGLSGLVFGIVEQSIPLYLLGGVAIGYTFGVCTETALSAKA